MNSDWRQIALRWLGRFSFSFLVIGFFLTWEGYKRYTAANAQAGDWRTVVYFIGAMASVALGFAGLRERHRR